MVDGLNSRSHQYVFFAEAKTVSFEVLTDEVLPCKICAYRASQMKYFKVSWRYFRLMYANCVFNVDFILGPTQVLINNVPANGAFLDPPFFIKNTK